MCVDSSPLEDRYSITSQEERMHSPVVTSTPTQP